MNKILKYELSTEGNEIVIEAAIVKWLDVQVQNGNPVVWAIVNPEKEPNKNKIVAWGTGWPAPEVVTDRVYLGTCQVDGFVWHYFVKTEYSNKVQQKHSQYLENLFAPDIDRWTHVTVTNDMS